MRRSRRQAFALALVALVAIACSGMTPPTMTTATATATPTPTPTPTVAAPATTAAVVTGRITGSLGYPSTFIPELTVYAMRQDDPSRFFSVDTPLYREAPQGSATYTIEGVTPGTYFVVAYQRTSPKGTTKGGGWSVFARCGNSANCGDDHTLIPVVVTAGGTASGANTTDWYLRQDQHFPPKPN